RFPFGKAVFVAISENVPSGPKYPILIFVNFLSSKGVLYIIYKLGEYLNSICGKKETVKEDLYRPNQLHHFHFTKKSLPFSIQKKGIFLFVTAPSPQQCQI